MNHYTKIAILTALAITLSVAVTVRAQPVKALPGGSCAVCAKDFAPGQLSKDSGLPSKDFAPGQEAKSFPAPCSQCNGASVFAPGQEKNSIGGGTCSICNGASDFAPGQEKKHSGGSTITGP